MSQRKQEIITFKVDESLSQAMEGITNRSAFIRTAILNALENVCPLCLGTGVLAPNQRKHWEEFSRTHFVERCEDCNATHIVCAEEQGEKK